MAPAESAARNGAKRKRLGGRSIPAGAHSANGIVGATSGDASLPCLLTVFFSGITCQAARVTFWKANACAVACCIHGAALLIPIQCREMESGIPCSKVRGSCHKSMRWLETPCTALIALGNVQMRKAMPIKKWPGRMQPWVQTQTALRRQRKAMRAEPTQDPAQDALRWGILPDPLLLSSHIQFIGFRDLI